MDHQAQPLAPELTLLLVTETHLRDLANCFSWAHTYYKPTYISDLDQRRCHEVKIAIFIKMINLNTPKTQLI